MNERANYLKDIEGKFNPKLVKLFDELVKKYKEQGLEQTMEYLILNKDGKRIHVLKRPQIETNDGGKIDIEDYIKKLIE